MFCNLNGVKVIFVACLAFLVQTIQSQGGQFEMMTTQQIPPTIKPHTPVPITVYEASSTTPQVLKAIGTLIPAGPPISDANSNRNRNTRTTSMQSSCSDPQYSNINTRLTGFQTYTQNDRTTTTVKPKYCCPQVPVENNIQNGFAPNINLPCNFQSSNFKSNSAGQSYGAVNPNLAIRTAGQTGINQNIVSKSTTFPSPQPFNFEFNPSSGWTTPLPTPTSVQSSANLINIPFHRMQAPKTLENQSPYPKPSCNLVLAPLSSKPNLCSGIFAFVNNAGKPNSEMSSFSLTSNSNPIEKYPSVFNLDSYCGAPSTISGLDSNPKSAQCQNPCIIQNAKQYNPGFVGSNQNVFTCGSSAGYPNCQAYGKPVSCPSCMGCGSYNSRYYY